MRLLLLICIPLLVACEPPPEAPSQKTAEREALELRLQKSNAELRRANAAFDQAQERQSQKSDEIVCTKHYNVIDQECVANRRIQRSTR